MSELMGPGAGQPVPRRMQEPSSASGPQQPARMAPPAVPTLPDPVRHVAPTPPQAARDSRRHLVAFGAGALAVLGAAASGFGYLLSGGSSDGEAKKIDNAAGETFLKPDDPILSAPETAEPAFARETPTPEPSPTPSAEPSAAPTPDSDSLPDQPDQQRTIRPERREGSRKSGGRGEPRKANRNRRVLQDPSDDDMSGTNPERSRDTEPEKNREADSSPAEVEPSKAFQAPPPGATLTATSPLAPQLPLKTTAAWHLARRAGIGVSAADVADIERLGIPGWIDAQLKPETIDDSHVEAVIAKFFPWANAATADVARHTNQLHRIGPQVTNSLLARARFTKRVLAEQVIDVIANHIYVPIPNKAIAYSAEYDQLLRKHALGRYADTLHALITHPALLVELDNHVNTKANPNENLGRELLELYTVGVGHYDEDDVRHSALLLTGHSLDWQKYRYLYRANQHHTGPLHIMEFADPNEDPAAGPELLGRYVEYLAKHPGTARRLAHRFAVRFISDEPSEHTVNELAEAYLRADTSVAALVKATLTHPDFMAAVGQKWRRPMELISSISRAAQVYRVKPEGRLGGGEEYSIGTYGWLIQQARNLPRAWPVVDGYPDSAHYWNSAATTLQMINATQDAVLGDKKESGLTSWSTALGINAGDDAPTVARRITWHLTGYEWSEAHLGNIAMLLAGGETATGQAVPAKDLDFWVSQAVRVIFASPYASLR